MKYYLRLHIHSCFASFSSNDIFISKRINKNEFEEMKEDEKTESVNVSKKYNFSVIYLKSDEKFYDSHFGLGKTRNQKDIRDYVWTTYLVNGWNVFDSELSEKLTLFIKDNNKKEERWRKREGFIFPSFEIQKAMSWEQYQGGFSDDVFNRSDLTDYIKGGIVFGYIGHFVRKKDIDKVIEKEFLQINSDKDLLCLWLTSSGGRHFADSLEGSNFNEQEAYIKSQIPFIVEQALEYRNDE